jgi:hypothetical protein
MELTPLNVTLLNRKGDSCAAAGKTATKPINRKQKRLHFMVMSAVPESFWVVQPAIFAQISIDDRTIPVGPSTGRIKDARGMDKKRLGFPLPKRLPFFISLLILTGELFMNHLNAIEKQRL